MFSFTHNKRNAHLNHTDVISHFSDCKNKNLTPSVGKALGKQALPYIAGGNANWHNLYGGKFGKSFETLYAFDTAIQLLIIYPCRHTANNMKIDVYKRIDCAVVQK